MLCFFYHVSIGLPKPQLNFVAQSFIPTIQFPFAIQSTDYRICWAINTGSYQNLPMVPIYQPHLLDTQLTVMMQ